MGFNRQDWEEKTNRLLGYAAGHCIKGDILCLWYLWPSADQENVHLKLWWTFQTNKNEPCQANVTTIKASRIARLSLLKDCFEPDFEWLSSELRPSLKSADVVIG